MLGHEMPPPKLFSALTGFKLPEGGFDVLATPMVNSAEPGSAVAYRGVFCFLALSFTSQSSLKRADASVRPVGVNKAGETVVWTSPVSRKFAGSRALSRKPTAWTKGDRWRGKIPHESGM